MSNILNTLNCRFYASPSSLTLCSPLPPSTHMCVHASCFSSCCCCCPSTEALACSVQDDLSAGPPAETPGWLSCCRLLLPAHNTRWVQSLVPYSFPASRFLSQSQAGPSRRHRWLVLPRPQQRKLAIITQKNTVFHHSKLLDARLMWWMNYPTATSSDAASQSEVEAVGWWSGDNLNHWWEGVGVSSAMVLLPCNASSHSLPVRAN